MLNDFLQRNWDVFVWQPSNMLGILREVVEHLLHIKPDAKLVKQHLRLSDEDRRKAIGEKIAKL